MNSLCHPSTALSNDWERSWRGLRPTIYVNYYSKTSTLSMVETLDTTRGHTPRDDMACWFHLWWHVPMACMPCVTKKWIGLGPKGIESGWHMSPNGTHVTCPMTHHPSSGRYTLFPPELTSYMISRRRIYTLWFQHFRASTLRGFSIYLVVFGVAKFRSSETSLSLHPF